MLSDDKIHEIASPIVRRFLHQAHHLGSPSDAFDELMSIAYIVAREHPNEKSIRTWIVWKLAEYVKLPQDELTDRRRMYRSGEIDPAYAAIHNELEQRLKEAIEALSLEERDVMSWYFVMNFTYPQIGELFGKSREGVRMKIKQTLEKLRLIIEGD